MKNLVRVLAAALVVVLTACASQAERQNATNEVRIAATPKATPQRTITNFSASIRCMDDLFSRYNVVGLTVGSQDIPDQTDVVIAGTKDMLITALSNMSIKSNAIRFVALGQDLEDITRFHTLHKRRRFTAPDFFIRGAVTQVDQGVIEKQESAGARVARYFSIEASRDRIASIITLDMNMGLVSNLQILPGVTASNSIAVVRRGKGLDLTGTIEKLGALFRVDFTHSEGLHHALRTLVELGAIEIMGKLTQVPYWECLDIETTNSFVQRQAQDWYSSLSREELVKFIQAKLRALAFYDGEVDGFENEGLRRAIALFKSERNLTANGDPDFLLYYTLIADPIPIDAAYLPLLTKGVEYPIGSGPRDELTAEKTIPQETTLKGSSLTPVELSLATERGRKPVYRRGESAKILLETPVDAYVYCFYQPNGGSIVKIFPNRFDPESKILGGETHSIPSDEKFEIRFDKPGTFERILCIASYKDVERRLPFELRDKNLQPVSLERLTRIYKRKIASLDDIYRIYKNSADIVPLKKSLLIEVQ